VGVQSGIEEFVMQQVFVALKEIDHHGEILIPPGARGNILKGNVLFSREAVKVGTLPDGALPIYDLKVFNEGDYVVMESRLDLTKEEILEALSEATVLNCEKGQTVFVQLPESCDTEDVEIFREVFSDIVGGGVDLIVSNYPMELSVGES
jgi:hypothetical protein